MKGLVEHVSEVKTSKLGAILLTLMVIFIFSISQNFLNDISYIVEVPKKPSSCILQLAKQKPEYLKHDICKESKSYYYAYTDNQSQFQFNQTDIKYGLNSQYQEVISKLQPLFTLNSQIDNANNDLRGLRDDLQDQDPDLSPLQIKNQKQDINLLEDQRQELYLSLQPELQTLESDYNTTNNKVGVVIFFYLLAQFGLQLIFILPVFVLGLKKYFQLKKQNSPFTVIATAVVAAASILLLQVVLGFLFKALPWGVLAKIWTWFQNFQFLKYILYYSIVIATIALFGGVVYYIQKSNYASDKVTKRRLLKNQCPRCETKIKDSYNNCRGCGLELKKTCPGCKQNTSKFFKFCSNCGHNLTKK